MNFNQVTASLEMGKHAKRGKTEIYGQSPVIYCEGRPWLPSDEDMAATDWVLVAPEKTK